MDPRFAGIANELYISRLLKEGDAAQLLRGDPFTQTLAADLIENVFKGRVRRTRCLASFDVDISATFSELQGVQLRCCDAGTSEVMGYVVDVVRATRTSPSLALGVSPRGATALLATSRAWAWLSGREFVTPDDVQSLARPTFRHRIQLRPEAELEGVTVDGVLETVLASVPVPR